MDEGCSASCEEGRRRRRNLLRFLDRLDAEYGPSDPADLERGRGVILTGDPDDLTRLAAAYPTVTVRRT